MKEYQELLFKTSFKWLTQLSFGILLGHSVLRIHLTLTKFFIVAPEECDHEKIKQKRVVVAPTNLQQRLKSSLRCNTVRVAAKSEKNIVNGILESNVILEPFLRLLRSSQLSL